MVYFISGHRDLTVYDFEKIYKAKINSVIYNDPNPQFVVGDYQGADIMAQTYLKYLVLKGYIKPSCIRVFFIGDKPMNFAFDDMPEVGKIGGFIDDIDRDAAMTVVSDFDIAFIQQGRLDSGTAQNIIRRAEIL